MTHLFTIKRALRYAAAALLAIATIIPAMTMPAMASGERSLYLHYTHTKETARITFKRNGRFVQEGLDQLNVFLRDWRRNEPANMDPALFDVLWEVYQATGSNQPIHIVSAYRAPATNAMLRASSSGVAENSQHTAGRAVDFYIPGVPTETLRQLGFRLQAGGVGYYPSSGTPFVHLDTGSVRAWPRMTTAQLRDLFPDGQTLHIGTDGTVLSQEGRQVAQAQWDACGRVPCSAGASRSGGDTQVAETRRPRTLMDLFFGGGDDEELDVAEAAIAQAPAPAPAAAPAPAPAAPAAQVATAPQAPAAQAPAQDSIAVEPPAPPARPEILTADATPAVIPFQVIDAEDIPAQVATADASTSQSQAPVPPARPDDTLLVAEATPQSSSAPQTAVQAIAGLDGLPPSRPDFDEGTTFAAYAPSSGPGVEIDTTAITASLPVQLASTPLVRAQAMPSPSGLDAFATLFDGPITRADEGAADEAATANAMATLTVEPGQLYAPDLTATNSYFNTDQSISGASYGALMDPISSSTAQSTRVASSSSTFSDLPRFGESDTIWVRLQ